MPARPKNKTPEDGFEKSIAQLRDLPLLPEETSLLVQKTAASVGNLEAFNYGINNALHTYFEHFRSDFRSRKMTYDEVLRKLRLSIEDVCVLHSDELEVSAHHMQEMLWDLRVLPRARDVSLLEMDTVTQQKAKDFVLVASVWRKNGGRSTWKQDGKLLMDIVSHHGHELDRACEAIRATKSISGPFVAVMDSVPTPLAQGAL